MQMVNKCLSKVAYAVAKFPFLNDETALRMLFRVSTGMSLNLDKPQTFNEKLQWLKLYDRNPLYTLLVDKYEAKQWVRDRIGENYVVPTYGVWDSFDEIDFDDLPERFVLKCTHDSGGIAICRDKATFDFNSARRKIRRSLKRNYYWTAREWPYKDVPARVIAEKYLEPSDDMANSKKRGMEHILPDGMVDYKFYCFSGVPRLLYVSKGLEDHSTARISFLSLDWEFAPFNRSDYLPFEELPYEPKCLQEMIRVAKDLAAGIPFVRVDLYEVSGSPLFSEMTFSPCAGFMSFNPAEWDLRLGAWIELPRTRL